MAKSQLFGPPVLTYIYKHGGVFPVRRGHHDEEAFKTAYTILDQGEMLLVYAEGGRSRSRRAGRAETGHRPASRSNPARRSSRSRSTARPAVRRWKRLRFPKVTVQFGEPLTFPVEEAPEPRAPARGRRARSSTGCGRCTRGWSAGKRPAMPGERLRTNAFCFSKLSSHRGRSRANWVARENACRCR